MGGRAAAALTIAVFAVAVCPLRAVRTAGAAPAPLFSLAALLTVAPDLPIMSKRVLVSEAERIWRREGVTLQWPRPRAAEAPTAPLRVLVIARREAVAASDDGEWTVGELVPQSGQRALAIASIAGAERVLVKATVNRRLLLESPELAEYRLGVILGRAVAHEIGHYLLATATHADHGLMRATIDAREFADPGARTFALDEGAGQWLRNHLLASRASNTPLLPGSFNYSPPGLTQRAQEP